MNPDETRMNIGRRLHILIKPGTLELHNNATHGATIALFTLGFRNWTAKTHWLSNLSILCLQGVPLSTSARILLLPTLFLLLTFCYCTSNYIQYVPSNYIH